MSGRWASALISSASIGSASIGSAWIGVRMAKRFAAGHGPVVG